MGCGSSNTVEEPYLGSLHDNRVEPAPDQTLPAIKNPGNEQPHYNQLPGIVSIPSNEVQNSFETNEPFPPHQDRRKKKRTHSRFSNESEPRHSGESHRRSSSQTSGGRLRSKSKHSMRPSRSHHSRPTFVAIFDYKARSGQDMNFHKGDLMELLDDKEGEDWRQALHLVSKAVGLVPSAYIAKNGSLHSKE